MKIIIFRGKNIFDNEESIVESTFDTLKESYIIFLSIVIKFQFSIKLRGKRSKVNE